MVGLTVAGASGGYRLSIIAFLQAWHCSMQSTSTSILERLLLNLMRCCRVSDLWRDPGLTVGSWGYGWQGRAHATWSCPDCSQFFKTWDSSTGMPVVYQAQLESCNKVIYSAVCNALSYQYWFNQNSQY